MLHVPPAVTFLRTDGGFRIANGSVGLSIDARLGRFTAEFPAGTLIFGAVGEVQLPNGRFRSTRDYTTHTVGKGDVQAIRDPLGRGIEVVVHHRHPGWPELRSVFWVYSGRPEVFVRLDLVGNGATVSTRSLIPIQTNDPVELWNFRTGPIQSLFVPYDNDMYSRYSSAAWTAKGGSYELGALYGERGCLTVGSIDHDTWKSAIRFGRSGLRVVAGVADPQTHDAQPAPQVTGKEVRSPRFVMGEYATWREGLDRFGDLNAIVHPPLRWKDGVLFGWSSWSGHKDKVNAEDARAATDFVHDRLPMLRSGGTAYINLDSFWDNLKPAEIEAFVRHAHALGLKAGIYYSPFVGWGKLTDRVAGLPYTYGDLALKGDDGQPLPKLDGGYPLDPTHPGELQRIDAQFRQFLNWGFDEVKLDFLTHGALEGRHHDASIQTGNQAYSFAMRHIDQLLASAARPIFIDLSIAPLFPSGFGHARRVSCDVFANIGATEYLLNATTYGFWTNHRLYAFNDPDSACVYQPLGEKPVTEAEARSRFTASVITGGMIISGDDLTKPAPRARVEAIFENRALLALAREAPAFWPLENDTGSKAADSFAWTDAHAAYLALFSFSKKAVDRTVDLRSALPGVRSGPIFELWTGKRAVVRRGRLLARLGPYGCAIFKFRR